MRTKTISAVLLVVFTLVACAPVDNPAPTPAALLPPQAASTPSPLPSPELPLVSNGLVIKKLCVSTEIQRPDVHLEKLTMEPEDMVQVVLTVLGFELMDAGQPGCEATLHYKCNLQPQCGTYTIQGDTSQHYCCNAASADLTVTLESQSHPEINTTREFKRATILQETLDSCATIEDSPVYPLWPGVLYDSVQYFWGPQAMTAFFNRLGPDFLPEAAIYWQNTPAGQ